MINNTFQPRNDSKATFGVRTNYLLTICVPTANRPELAKRAVAAILNEDLRGVQVLILENSNDPTITAADFGGATQVVVSRSARMLSMPDNWERGVTQASGRYVAYLSDKEILVPGALNEALKYLRRASPQVLCYRKAWFDSETGNFYHYQCRGGVKEVDTAPLLQSWIRHPRHIHSAPMIYNSFVSRDFIERVRSVNGRFFVGSSPDVCSGLLIAAYLPAYSQLDMMVAVAHGGIWSTGSTALRHGVSKHFIDAFATNPFSTFGLPETVSSSVLEVLLTVQKMHRHIFPRLKINWKRFVDDASAEIYATSRSIAEKNREFYKLLSVHCVVPKYYVVSKLLKHAARTLIPHSLAHKLDQTAKRKLARSASQFAEASVPGESCAWDDRNYQYVSHAASIDASVAMAATNNHAC